MIEEQPAEPGWPENADSVAPESDGENEVVDETEELEEGWQEETGGFEPPRDLKSGVADELLLQEILPPVPYLHDIDIPPPDREAEPEEEEEEEPGSKEEDEEQGDEKGVREGEKEGEKDDDAAIPQSLLARVNRVFVEPPGYRHALQDQLERIIDGYVFIVHGDEHAGKLTCALHLAQDLLGRKGAEKRIYFYRRFPEESLSLLDLVQKDNVRDECVYIIEDAFPTVAREDLEEPFLHLLNERLQEKKSFLLLTTDHPARTLPVGVAKVSAAITDLRKVFLNHLALYETGEDRIRIERPVLELAGESWDAIQKELKDPDQIDEFCRRLGVQGGLPDAEGLRKLAQEIALRRIEAVRPWFAGLRLHEKLIAFLIILFPGRDSQSLYEIFLNAVAKLRDQGMNLVDPRKIGYEDLLDRIRAEKGPTRDVSFHERAIGAEVEWQIKNYNHLLWTLVPWFFEEIQKSSGRKAGEIRKSWATAVGRIGLHQPVQLREKLEVLARHPAREVAAASGYAFSEVCLRDRDADEEVCRAISAWVISRESRLLWAASSCIWRVYSSLKRNAWDASETRIRLLDILEGLLATLEEQVKGKPPFNDEDWKNAWVLASRNAPDAGAAKRQALYLIRSWAKRNRESMFYAIKQMVAVDPIGMIERLRLWLTSGQPTLRQASRDAIRLLFEDAAQVVGPPRQRHLAFADLIEPVLTHCGEGSAVTTALFNALGKWVGRWINQPVSTAATTALLRAANRLTGRAAKAFRSALTPWLTSSSSEVRKLGGSLYMRSLFLEGTAVPAPASLNGALVLDASSEALSNPGYEQIARRVWSLLQSRFDLRLVRMGENRELAGPGEMFPPSVVLAERSRPRLLLPTLDAFGGLEKDVVVVLAAGPVLDLDEVSVTSCSSRLILVNLGKAVEETAPLWQVRIDFRSPESGLAELVAKVDDSFVAAIARTGTCAPAGDDFEARLEQWVLDLDQPQSLHEPVDRVTAILLAIMELAGYDLERCSALLSRWLAPGRNDLELRAGFAAVHLLMRVEAHKSPPLAAARVTLFRLVTQLEACGRQGVEAALFIIRRLLKFGEWTGTLLGHDRDEPAPLLQWLEGLLPGNGELISRTLAEWRRSSGDDSSDAVQRLIESTDRIEEWIASRARDTEEETAPDAVPDATSGNTFAAEIRVSASEGPDRVGFPMVWIEEIGAFMHWLPVTKIQFERFIAATSDPLFDDTWYRRVLELNPRETVSRIGPENYGNAFLTGILPDEACRFAAWCGREYSLPSLEEWQRAYAALTAVPAAAGGIPGLLEGAGDLARLTLAQIESAVVRVSRSGYERTQAEQMLMRRGVLEWVEQNGDLMRWRGMGEPAPQFRMLWSVARGPSIPRDANSCRSNAFGFRLIRRPA